MRWVALLACSLVIAAAVSGCGGSEPKRFTGTITFKIPPAAIWKAVPKVCPDKHATNGCVSPMLIHVQHASPDPLHRFLAWLSRLLRR